MTQNSLTFQNLFWKSFLSHYGVFRPRYKPSRSSSASIQCTHQAAGSGAQHIVVQFDENSTCQVWLGTLCLLFGLLLAALDSCCLYVKPKGWIREKKIFLFCFLQFTTAKNLDQRLLSLNIYTIGIHSTYIYIVIM